MRAAVWRGVLCIQPLAGAFSFLLSAGAGAGLCALLPAGWLMPAIKENDPPGDERPHLSAAATRWKQWQKASPRWRRR